MHGSEGCLEWWLAADSAAGRRGPRAGLRMAAGLCGRRPGRRGDLARGELDRHADLAGLDLIDGALVAFPGFAGPLPEPAVHDDAGAPLDALAGNSR